MRRHDGWKVVAAVTVTIVTLGACGDDGNDAEGEAGGDDTEAEAESDDGNGLEGDWEATPGQADAIEATLTSQGYECSSHAGESLDIRMCAKGRTDEDEFGGPTRTLGRLRFMADSEGTVVMAAIDGDISRVPLSQWDELEAEMVEALLPPDDAAVLLADGTTLGWGTVERGQREPDDVFSRIHGLVPPAPAVDAPPLTTGTAEEVLPSLQSAGLECTFEDQPLAAGPATLDTGDSPYLSCLDPSFTSENEDGSIEGATAEATLVDDASGIVELSVEGRHGSLPDDLRGLEELLAKLVTTLDEEPLPQIQDWVAARRDDVAHSAYIGTWQVTLYPTAGGTFGDSVGLVLTPESPDFGASSI